MACGVYHEFHCRPGERPAEALKAALLQIKAAERRGLDAIRPARIRQQPDRSPLSVPMTVASAIAARTRRIRIGTGVQVWPSCHPRRLAKEGARGDWLSGGRLIFGVGRSSNPRRCAVYGVPYSKSRERVADRCAMLRDELGLAGILAKLNFVAPIPPQRMTNAPRRLCEQVMPRCR